MIGDNYTLFLQHDAEQERQLAKLPVCWLCGEHIQQDSAVQMYGRWYCDNCLDDCRVTIDYDF